MKLFRCDACQQIVHFENSQCTRCGRALAYLPDRGIMSSLAPGYRSCGNQIDHGACNWAVADGDAHRFCRSCRLNEVIPNLSDPKARDAWLKLEQNKRRLVFSLLELGLPVEPRPHHRCDAHERRDADGDQQARRGHDR